MEAKEFATKVRRLSSLQSVTIRFAKEGKAGLMRLHNLFSLNPGVRLANDRDRIVMLAVIQSGEWGGDYNRTYTLYGLSTVEDHWLFAIARDIEHIEIGEHGAKDLMTGRQKRRDEAAQKIIADIQTRDLEEEMRSWGIVMNGYLTERDELPLITFDLVYDGNDLGSVSIDGWSGRISAMGAIGARFDELYVRPEQVQELIRKRVEATIEKLTA